jgi:hypothetical protein
VSDEVRASLAAVKSAQAAARSRARRETRLARLALLGGMMAIGATAWAAARRPPKAHVTASPTPMLAAAVAAPTAPVAAPPLEQPAPAEAAAPAEQPAASAIGNLGRTELCDAAFEQRHWLAIKATCAAAFEAKPQDSALAMRVAQAEHRRGHIAQAGDWARKALALDANIPEAQVIVARAEVQAHHGAEAADAYRSYLKLAPRGWHAREARRALRAARD